MGSQRLRGVLALVALAVLGLSVAGSAGAGGPIVLAGIDAEDGSPWNGHGPIASYQTLAGSVLSNVTNGGSGILGIGCGKSSFDDVTFFANAIASGNGTTVTCVNGAAIGSAALTGYAMIYVASDQFNTYSGGLTNAENTALGTRSSDIASFVNNGGGLLGFSNAALSTPYPYLGGIGSFSFGTVFDSNINPTPAGLAVGITDALDVCCWHDSYNSFPSFLGVLATYNNGAAAAIGGVNVTITTMSLTPATATLNTGDTHTVTANVVDQSGVAQVGVTVYFVVSGANSASGSAVTDASGNASFSYVGTTQGNDSIEAFADMDGNGVQNGNEPFGFAKAEWVNSPPDCSTVTATGPDMWPPNHKLRSFTLGGATDPDGDAVTLTVTGVTQDEPVDAVGNGDGNTSPDATATGASVDLRGERAGGGDGRVYVVSFSGDDGNGATCSGTVAVSVPHDQGAGSTAVDSGQLYNSLIP